MEKSFIVKKYVFTNDMKVCLNFVSHTRFFLSHIRDADEAATRGVLCEISKNTFFTEHLWTGASTLVMKNKING